MKFSLANSYFLDKKDEIYAEKETLRDFQDNLLYSENSTQILDLLYQNVILYQIINGAI